MYALVHVYSVDNLCLASGEGTLFTVDLLDANGDEIRGTFFKEEADRFYDFIRKGMVYNFSGGKLRESNKKFTSIKHPFSISFDKSTIINEAHTQAAYAIKDQCYHFVKIGNIENLPDDTTVDILGVVTSASDVTEIVTQKNEPLLKRSITVADDSLHRQFQHNAIDVTIFGDRANQFDFDGTPVVAFKNLKKSAFNNCSLVFKYDTEMSFNPPEGRDLWIWKEQEMKNTDSINICNVTFGSASVGKFDDIFKRKSIVAIDDEHLGLKDAEYFTLKARISFIKRGPATPFYLSCPSKHKLIEKLGGGFTCEKCLTDFTSGVNLYLINMVLADQGSSHWFTAFDEAGKVILGMTADQLSVINPNEYDDVFNAVMFHQFLFRIRSSMHTYQDESSVRSTIIAVQPLDLVDECKQMIKAIARY